MHHPQSTLGSTAQTEVNNTTTAISTANTSISSTGAGVGAGTCAGVDLGVGSGSDSSSGASFVGDEFAQRHALAQLFASMRALAANTRAQGTSFERLMLQALQLDPVYAQEFSRVQLYPDWAKAHPELNTATNDCGIDLVAALRAPVHAAQPFVAIQCKFYQDGVTITKHDVDSFLANSSRSCFAYRILIATSNEWSANLRHELQEQEKPVHVITTADLVRFAVDWSHFLDTGQLTRAPKNKLRPYQEDAVEAVLNGFAQYDRGKLIMACGSGKTFTALKIAENFTTTTTSHSGLILFVVPSLALLNQSMQVWLKQSELPLIAIPVCSDRSVGQDSSKAVLSPKATQAAAAYEDASAAGCGEGEECYEDDLLFNATDLPFAATTDAQALASQVQRAQDYIHHHDDVGNIAVFSTYHSLKVISRAQHEHAMASFDLIISDEAHRTAGGYYNADIVGKEQESFFTRIHDASFIRGRKRLYMTATPKVYGVSAKEQELNHLVTLYSMDDESIFGPLFYSLSFTQAVQLGILVDFKLLVPVIDTRAIAGLGPRDQQDAISKVVAATCHSLQVPATAVSAAQQPEQAQERDQPAASAEQQEKQQHSEPVEVLAEPIAQDESAESGVTAEAVINAARPARCLQLRLTARGVQTPNGKIVSSVAAPALYSQESRKNQLTLHSDHDLPMLSLLERLNESSDSSAPVAGGTSRVSALRSAGAVSHGAGAASNTSAWIGESTWTGDAAWAGKDSWAGEQSGADENASTMAYPDDETELLSPEVISDLSQNNLARLICVWKALNKYGLGLREQPMQRVLLYAAMIDSERTSKRRNTKGHLGSVQIAKFWSEGVARYSDYINAQCVQWQASQHLPAAALAGEASALAPQTQSLPGQHVFWQNEQRYLAEHPLTIDCQHIDGHMDALTKTQKLEWLQAEVPTGVCKVLTNVRCLQEGVDVPALDAVVFNSPRRSQIEVAQIIGRVMRPAPDKKLGYVIVPVVTANGEAPQEVLAQSDEFQVVWQVIAALKSLNPQRVLVDGKFHKLDAVHIEIISCQQDLIARRRHSAARPPRSVRALAQASRINASQGEYVNWEELEVTDEEIAAYEEYVFNFVSNIKLTLVQKFGSAHEWTDWAQDVGRICARQVGAVKELFVAAARDPLHQHFIAAFKHELEVATNVQNFSDADIEDLVAQYLVIRPVLEALFQDYPFMSHNAISQALSMLVSNLDQHDSLRFNADLQAFYEGINLRLSSLTTFAERQSVIIELFAQFFKVAFPKLQDKYGIVYTPVPLVDFMLQSVEAVLKRYFTTSFTSPEVHVLDPFAGTGTFLTRLMQSGLISKERLEDKYLHELHSFEILPLAYFISALNIEAVFLECYHKIHGHPLPVHNYRPNKVMSLTDTFRQGEGSELLNSSSALLVNQLRRQQVEQQPLRVIMGNPPYSVGQDSHSDDNQNDKYPEVDARIAATFGAQSGNVANKNSLYDSYIRAIRWAADRLQDNGVLCFVMNAGWLHNIVGAGIRRSLQQEFAAIYIFHLKGNGHVLGADIKKEGGKIFGSGSRAPVAITLLVKNSKAKEQGQIFYSEVPDGLNLKEKLEYLQKLGSMFPQGDDSLFRIIIPDEFGDWFNQRRTDFADFISVDGKNPTGEKGLFASFSRGTVTSRDAWSFSTSRPALAAQMSRCITFYNQQLDCAEQSKAQGHNFKHATDDSRIKWERELEKNFARGRRSEPFDPNKAVESLYRPFVKKFLYNDRLWLSNSYQMPFIYPEEGMPNLTITVMGTGVDQHVKFSCLMTNSISCLGVIDNNQCLPRYLYYPVDSKKGKAALQVGGVQQNGYVRVDALSFEGLQHFREAYPEHETQIDADTVFYYIYGLLHSPEYRENYDANLHRELARIPRVATWEEFMAFVQAGRALAHLHVDYEQVAPYSGCIIKQRQDHPSYYVHQLQYGKIKGVRGNAGRDKTVIRYNEDITISAIPLQAQDYVVNKKSALDWIVERCGVSQDKVSQLVQDYNDMATEKGDERYILNLILRLVTVSLESVQVIKSLPALHLHPLEQHGRQNLLLPAPPHK